MTEERRSAPTDSTGWTVPEPGDGSLEDDLLDPWDEEPAGSEIQRAGRRALMRGVLFVLVLAVAAASVVLTLTEFRYFLTYGEAPVDLGDVRARRIAGEESLNPPDNAYVSIANQLMTYEAESDHYQYFLDPLYFVITRTERDLPEKRQYRSVEVPAELIWLLQERHAFPEDLTVGFDGTGRLLRADRAPRWARAIYDAYRDILRDRPADQVYLFLDGETPADYVSYAVAYGVAVLLVLLTGFFFLRAVLVYRRARRQA